MKFILLVILFAVLLPSQVEAQTLVNAIKFQNRPDYHPTVAGYLWRKNDQLMWTMSTGETPVATGSGGGGASMLGDLGDVSLGTLYNGQVLSYDVFSGMWENKYPQETSIDPRYVTTSTSQTISGAKDFTGGLSANGTSVATSIASCADTDVSTAATGHVLQWDAVTGKWYSTTNPSGVTQLQSLSDVNVTTRSAGDIFMYSGTTWYNVDPGVLPLDSRYVTTATGQTISGAKTWTATQSFSSIAVSGRFLCTGAVSYSASVSPISANVDYVYCDVSGGSISLGLPLIAGKMWKFKVTGHSASNVVTLTPVSGNIDGASYNDATLNGANISCEVHCDGTNFWLY